MEAALTLAPSLALEVHVGVHVVAPVGGVLRVQGVAAELLQGLLVYQRTQVLISNASIRCIS